MQLRLDERGTPLSRGAIQYFPVIVGFAIALLFGAIQTSFFPWVDVALYIVAAVLSLIALGLLVPAIWRFIRDHWISTQPDARQALFSIRLPENPARGSIDGHQTVWFDKALITKRIEGVRVLRFHLSMPGREFVDLGDYQDIYQGHPEIHTQYHSNPLDVPNNSQKALAFVIAADSDAPFDSFELSIWDTHTDQSFVVTSLGEHICFDDGSIELDGESPVSPDIGREQSRAWQDLEVNLGDILRAEKAAYGVLDSDLQERGVLRSGLRTSGLMEIAEEHDRQRDAAVLEWRRRMEDLGVVGIGEPPRGGVVHPSFFSDGGDYFDRSWSGRDPLFCGWCDRLLYVANIEGGESWWCPDHEYQVS